MNARMLPPALRLPVLLALTLLLTAPFPAPVDAAGRTTLRLGYFPNITHSQAVLGVADGTFTRALGPAVTLDAKIFNAGPSVIEAMFAGQLDLAYIGPNPAINGYVRSAGEALRIIAGATSGGASLVVREGAGIKTVKDFHGKRLASPQLGNTQDVALRAWLLENGYRLKEKGGDVEVLPLKNPDQLILFLKGEVDGAWAPEPWAARLVHEGHGRLFLDERTRWPGGRFVTAQVIVSAKFLKDHPDLVKRFLRAHVQLTRWINAHPAEAKAKLNRQLKAITGQPLPAEVMDDAMARLEVTWDPVPKSLTASAEAAFELGFLGKVRPNLKGIYALSLLNEVLTQEHLPLVKE